jgi:hypothetical protein
MVVAQDTDTHYYLDTPHVMKNKQRLCFATVRVGKAYVSLYLMPIYCSPDLLKDLSPALKKRMQGKSCFNFKTVDDKLFKELGKLTKSGFQKFTDPEFLRKTIAR